MYIFVLFVNIYGMALIIDIILITTITFLVSYIFLSFLEMSFLLQLICAMLCAFVISSIIYKLFFKDKKGTMSYRNFLTYLIWKGEDYAKTLISSSNKDKTYEDRGEYIMLDDTAIFLWTKYGRLSADTLVRLYRICIKDDIKKAYIITTNTDKKSLSFVKRFCDVIMVFDNFKPLYKKLRQQNILPEVKSQKTSKKQIFSAIFHTAFTRKNAVRFVCVSILLLAISFVTPFTNYYIFLSSLNLIFATICLVASIKRK